MRVLFQIPQRRQVFTRHFANMSDAERDALANISELLLKFKETVAPRKSGRYTDIVSLSTINEGGGIKVTAEKLKRSRLQPFSVVIPDIADPDTHLTGLALLQKHLFRVCRL